MRWLLPSPTPRLEDHVSIWSIQARDAGTFFRIATVLWLVALVRISYKLMEHADVPLVGWQNTVDFALAVLGEFGNVGIGTAMLAMLLTRPAKQDGRNCNVALSGNCEPIRHTRDREAQGGRTGRSSRGVDSVESASRRGQAAGPRLRRIAPSQVALRQACICVYPRHYHGTNVSGGRQRPGTLVAWSTSGAGPEPLAGEREGEPLARENPKPKAPAVGHFSAPSCEGRPLALPG